ncbi:hypothetical protein [Tardiphaga sp. 709]|uniref:hypothetical protein n=1 Tax=Tardiphaga sp. 709 TaxID=3076039 RepID=UPI0028E9C749|nr:hypothetical protein [Tardiphaga sp. 709]WNV10966.1 hypothetical protein RSO67_07265 [Tardiphaga sp. 709]
MPDSDAPLEGKYELQFKKHFEEIDELALTVLKSHLIMESAIDNIIRLVFFHPNLVLDARVSFFMKVQMVRAYALHENEMTIWKLILAISELRNEIAHSLEGAKRETRVASLRKLYLSEAPDLADRHKDYPDHLIVVFASSLCTGFLGEMEQDLTFLRKHIDSIAVRSVPKNKDGTPKKKK